MHIAEPPRAWALCAPEGPEQKTRAAHGRGEQVTLSHNVDIDVAMEGGVGSSLLRCCCTRESAFFAHYRRAAPALLLVAPVDIAQAVHRSFTRRLQCRYLSSDAAPVWLQMHCICSGHLISVHEGLVDSRVSAHVFSASSEIAGI